MKRLKLPDGKRVLVDHIVSYEPMEIVEHYMIKLRMVNQDTLSITFDNKKDRDKYLENLDSLGTYVWFSGFE